MNPRVCVLCGRRAHDDHHVTGWKLDPSLSFRHCHDHHELAHDDWNTAGVPAKDRLRDDSDSDKPSTVLHSLHLRLRRLSMWLGRLAEAGVFVPVSTALASAVARWADELEACLAGLDSHLAGWRDIPGAAS